MFCLHRDRVNQIQRPLLLDVGDRRHRETMLAGLCFLATTDIPDDGAQALQQRLEAVDWAAVLQLLAVYLRHCLSRPLRRRDRITGLLGLLILIAEQ